MTGVELTPAVGAALPIPTVADRSFWDQSGLDDTLHPVVDTARHEAASPWPEARATDYARYFREGNRTAYESSIAARQRRLSRLVLAAARANDPALLDAAVDGIILLCEQSSWCWAAHDDTYEAHGAVVPTVTDPFLDLGAGEVAAQLAWTDHVLGPALDQRWPGVRARIRSEAQRRVLVPFRTRRDWHWLGTPDDVDNWNPWIHGNLLVTVLALEDEVQQRRADVARIIDGLDLYLAALPPDGGIDEGYEYWWNGVGRCLEALSILDHATEGRLRIDELAFLRATVAFPHRMHLGGSWYLNVADASARPPLGQPWHVLHRWARAVGDDDARRHAAAHRSPGTPVVSEAAGLGRVLMALADAEWRHATPGAPPLVDNVWLPETEVAVARSEAGSSAGLTLAVKGGHNDEHHNHNDVGSVVVAVDGVPVIVDPGRGTYTARNFGPDRYSIWYHQSTWHSVPLVRGTPQSPGREYRARDMSYQVDDLGTTVRLDIASAYALPGLHRWWRTARLHRDAGTVEILDEWEWGTVTDVEDDDHPVVMHYLLAGTVSHVAPGELDLRPLHGAPTVRIGWPRERARATTTTRALSDRQFADVWGDHLTRLELALTADEPAGSFLITVEMCP